jgi:hypothetical protein
VTGEFRAGFGECAVALKRYVDGGCFGHEIVGSLLVVVMAAPEIG